MGKKTIDWVSGEVTTTDATSTVLLSYPIPAGTACMFSAYVIGRNTATGDIITANREAAAKNVSGTSTLIGSVQSLVTLNDTTMALATVTIDVSAGNARVIVTGLAATSIEWFGDMRPRVN